MITTTDAVGRRVTTTLPFYVSSSLLKSGLSDYAFSAGAIRENYGLKNFDYGAVAASGSYRYGMTDWLTLESHAEYSRHLTLVTAPDGRDIAAAKSGPPAGPIFILRCTLIIAIESQPCWPFHANVKA